MRIPPSTGMHGGGQHGGPGGGSGPHGAKGAITFIDINKNKIVNNFFIDKLYYFSNGEKTFLSLHQPLFL